MSTVCQALKSMSVELTFYLRRETINKKYTVNHKLDDNMLCKISRADKKLGSHVHGVPIVVLKVMANIGKNMKIRIDLRLEGEQGVICGVM